MTQMLDSMTSLEVVMLETTAADSRRLTVKVGREKLSLLLGRRKSNLERIRNRYRVKARITKWNDDSGRFAELTLVGAPDDVERAVDYVGELIEPVKTQFDIARRHTSIVVGLRGVVVRAVCALYGVKVGLDDSDEESKTTVTVSGPASSCAAAKEGIMALISEYAQ